MVHHFWHGGDWAQQTDLRSVLWGDPQATLLRRNPWIQCLTTPATWPLTRGDPEEAWSCGGATQGEDQISSWLHLNVAEISKIHFGHRSRLGWSMLPLPFHFRKKDAWLWCHDRSLLPSQHFNLQALLTPESRDHSYWSWHLFNNLKCRQDITDIPKHSLQPRSWESWALLSYFWMDRLAENWAPLYIWINNSA